MREASRDLARAQELEWRILSEGERAQAARQERFVNGLARGPMMFQIMVNRVVELLDATVLPNEYDDDPEAEAAFDAALKRGPRPRR